MWVAMHANAQPSGLHPSSAQKMPRLILESERVNASGVAGIDGGELHSRLTSLNHSTCVCTSPKGCLHTDCRLAAEWRAAQRIRHKIGFCHNSEFRIEQIPPLERTNTSFSTNFEWSTFKFRILVVSFATRMTDQ